MNCKLSSLFKTLFFPRFSLKKDNSGFISDFFEVLAGPPELLADVDSDDSDTDDDDVWIDDDMADDNLVRKKLVPLTI